MAPFRTASDLAIIDQRLCEAPEVRNYSIASLQTIDFLFLMLLTEVELHYFSLSFFPPASPSYSLPVTLCQTPPMPPTLKFIAFFSLIIFIMYIYVYTHVCTHTHVYIYMFKTDHSVLDNRCGSSARGEANISSPGSQ